MFIAGLTGGIASGKSTVSAMFQKAGAVIIDADLIARQIVAPGMPAWNAIVDQFGKGVILQGGGIDRNRLGDIVFNDHGRRRQLEKIIHPEVRARIRSQLDEMRKTNPHAVVIQDIPLLFEAGMTEGLAEIMVVHVPHPVQLARLIRREGLSDADARLRIEAQMPLEEKRRRATIVIDNSGGRDATRKQVVRIYDRFSARALGDT